jgi:hypothetical protein
MKGDGMRSWTIWRRPSVYSAIAPLGECLQNISGWESSALIAALMYFFYLFIETIYDFLVSWQLKHYFSNVLDIQDVLLIPPSQHFYLS